MNTYIIPLVNSQYRAVHAPDEEIAYKVAMQYSIKPYAPSVSPYEYFAYELSISSLVFTKWEKNAIIKNALQTIGKTESEIKMDMLDIYSYMYWGRL